MVEAADRLRAELEGLDVSGVGGEEREPSWHGKKGGQLSPPAKLKLTDVFEQHAADAAALVVAVVRHLLAGYLAASAQVAQLEGVG